MSQNLKKVPKKIWKKMHKFMLIKDFIRVRKTNKIHLYVLFLLCWFPLLYTGWGFFKGAHAFGNGETKAFRSNQTSIFKKKPIKTSKRGEQRGGIKDSFSTKDASRDLASFFKYETKREQQARLLREKEIQQVRMLLGRRSAHHRKGKLYLRLAELYQETYLSSFLLEGRKDQSERKQGAIKKGFSIGWSQAYLRKSIEAAQKILKYQLKDISWDQVYFLLGYNYKELHEEEKSKAFLKKLVSRYPNSQLVGNGYRFLGEIAYHKRAFQKARLYFQSAIRYGKRQDPWIWHKLAWCAFRLKRYQKAILEIKASFRLLKDQEKKPALLEQVLRDLAIFYGHTHQFEDALSFLKKAGKGQGFFEEALLVVAREYVRNLKYRLGWKVLKKIQVPFLKETSKKVFWSLYVLVYWHLKKLNALLSFLKTQVQSYGTFDFDVVLKKDVLDIFQQIEKSAVSQHKKWKNKKKVSLQKIGLFYELSIFFRRALNKKIPVGLVFNLAEVQKALGLIEVAIHWYKKLVYGKGFNLNIREQKQALTNWINLREGHLFRILKKEVFLKTPKREEYDYLKAVDLFVKKYPNDSNAPVLFLRSLQLFAPYLALRKSLLERILWMMRTWPMHEKTLKAVQLGGQIGGVYKKEIIGVMDQGEWEVFFSQFLEKAFSLLRKKIRILKKSQDKKKRVLLKKVLSLKELLFEKKFFLIKSKAQRAISSGERIEAARIYEKAAVLLNPFWGTQAYKAALELWWEEKEDDQVFHLFKKWFQSSVQKIDLKALVFDYADRYFLLRKPHLTALLLKNFGWSQKDIEALSEASFLYEALGEAKTSRELWKKLLNAFHSSQAKRAYGQVALRFGRAFISEGKKRKALTLFQNCARSTLDVRIECAFELGKLFLTLEEKKDARYWFARIVSERIKKTLSSSVVKRIQFFQALALFEIAKLKTEKMIQTYDSGKTTRHALQSLKKFSQAFEPVIHFGGPASIDAAFLVALRSSEVVEQLSSQKTLARSLLKRARGLFKKALQKANQNGWISFEWMRSQKRFYHAFKKLYPLAQGGFPKSWWSPLRPLSSVTRKNVSEKIKSFRTWHMFGRKLFQEGKKALAQFAFKKALVMAPFEKNLLNDFAIVHVLSHPETKLTWFESIFFWKRALKQDRFFWQAKANLASVYQYFKLFDASYRFWKKVKVLHQETAVWEGLGISLLGKGSMRSTLWFQKAKTSLGGRSFFARSYHQALLFFQKRKKQACFKTLSNFPLKDLFSWERSAYDLLFSLCHVQKKSE